jgi:effector-binding domain-containing protein
MKMFRRILFIFLSLIIVFLLVGFLLPRHVNVQRSLFIKSPRELLFDNVNSFRNWTKWSPWHLQNPGMKISYSGPESGPGAAFSFHSNNNDPGNGKFTITQSAAYDSIILDMDFLENGKATGKFRFTNSDSGTRVKWIMESDLGRNPVSRWFGLLMDKMVGKDLEAGLVNLKKLASETAANQTFTVLEKEVPARIVLTIRDSCSTATIGNKLGKFYEKISQLIKIKKLTVIGAPFAIYHNYSQQSFDLEAGLPVDRIIEPPANINCYEVPAQKTIMASYSGPYEKTAVVYAAIEKYIHDKNLTIAGSPWETYLTDPDMEKDTLKWQTDIYFPVK